MKKNTTVKKTTPRKPAAKVARATKSTPVKKQQCFNPWSLSIYVYWFIILFFIAATFYILGRSHDTVMGKTPGSVEITEEVLLQTSDYYTSGQEKLVAGNIEDAIADLTTAIDTGAADVYAYILRGEAYLQSGDYRSAAADFDTAISKDALNAIAYYDRALLNIRMENYSAALTDINNALASQAAHPTDVLNLRDLYARRGQLNLWMKNWDGAIADYTNSLSRKEGAIDPSVYAERAEAYTAKGQYVDAINDYTAAVRVISEQIQGATTAEEREMLSSNAMSYFEKSAALNLQIGDVAGAQVDLESAYTIAVALNDTATADRLQKLASELPVQE